MIFIRRAQVHDPSLRSLFIHAIEGQHRTSRVLLMSTVRASHTALGRKLRARYRIVEDEEYGHAESWCDGVRALHGVAPSSHARGSLGGAAALIGPGVIGDTLSYGEQIVLLPSPTSGILGSKGVRP